MTEQKQDIKKNTHKVPEYKLEETKNLVELIDNNNTIMFASIKGLPASNFQKIKKALKDKAAVKVIKKRALLRALEGSNKENIKKLEAHLKEDTAFLASNEDAFELSRILGESKSPVRAKAGQIALNDIEIEAGVTEIPAGPAVSELGSLGLQVKVTNGKIEIMKPKVIIKKDKEVTEVAASVMGKLDITPFEVGFVPLIAFDSNTGKIFEDLVIDSEKTINEMKNIFAKSRSLAVSLGYISKDIIGLFIGKAVSHESALSKLVKEDSVNAKTDEKAEVSEELTENKEEKGEVNKTEKVDETANKEKDVQKINPEEVKE